MFIEDTMIQSIGEFELNKRLVCIGCGKHPDDIGEYITMGKEYGCSPVEFVLMEEGTLNRTNGHFLCTKCYLVKRMPHGVAP